MEPHYAASMMDTLKDEVARRRTCAIISHPDAGKTTLTEKCLLYAGAVALAGAVRARKTQRAATSDWMALEHERGISVTVSALEMDYQGYRITLLDTPGHQDFSDDTSRPLMAVDIAVMVLDSAKGIELQTLQLFQVCRRRRLPLLTFINKLDRPGRDPLELLDEIARVLGMAAVPLNWPIGSGVTFQGVYDLRRHHVLRFVRTEHGQHRAPVIAAALDDATLPAAIGTDAYAELRDHLALLAGAGTPFERAAFLGGALTLVCFGSALTNFGGEPFFQAMLELAPAPGPRTSSAGVVDPSDPTFAGFVFKIQANMDPRHRDRMVFLRICAGRFQKDMLVHHARLGRPIRLSRAYRIFARARHPVDEVYAGDVIGIINPGVFAIGDTVTSGAPRAFPPLSRFSPEHFGLLSSHEVLRAKQVAKGLAQLEEEGAVQVFLATDSVRREPLLAVVGELQFDVAVARLRDEYGVHTRIERLPYAGARWLAGVPAAGAHLVWPTQGLVRCHDRDSRLVVLCTSAWELDYFSEQNPHVALQEVA